MFNGLLPIGSVVLLKNSVKKVMVVGLCQRGAHDIEKIWDYTGVIFPEGYLDSQKMFLFNNDQIEQIFAIGYQDAEQLAFKEKAESIITGLRNTSDKSDDA